MKKFLSMLLMLLVVSLFSACFSSRQKVSVAIFLQAGNEAVFNQIDEVLSSREDLYVKDLSQGDLQKLLDKGKQKSGGADLDVDVLCTVFVGADTYKVEFVGLKNSRKKTVNGEWSESSFSNRVDVDDLKKLKKIDLSDLKDVNK